MSNISSSTLGYYADVVTKSNVSVKDKTVFAQSAPKLSDDAYMPGTEGKILDVYTRYMPTSGGRMDYKTGTIQQGYIALTMFAGDGKGAPSNGLITASEIDPSKPGAVFSDGQWVNVTDFLAKHNRAANNTSQPGAAEQTETAKETYTWSLTREESAKIFGDDGLFYVSEMTSDDSDFNPFTAVRRIDPSTLRFAPPTPLQAKRGDILTLSPEGNQLANEMQFAKENRYAPNLRTNSYSDDLAHSKHQNVLALLLGISEESANVTVLGSSANIKSIRNQAMLETKILDSMVVDKLKKLGITLNDKETLNFSINNNGEIKVDAKGISDEKKRSEIEKALNGDNEFALQLKYTHALRTIGLDASDGVSFRFLLETHLQRELGLSLNEFSAPNGVGQGMTYQGKGADWIDQMYDEERNLYGFISACADTTRFPEYELSFSFRNGVVIENGVSDLDGMNKRFDISFSPHDSHSAEKTLTVDGNGDYVDSTFTREVFFNNDEVKKPSILAQAHDRLITNASGGNQEQKQYWNPFASGVLQETSFDAKRLLKFEFGVDAENLDDVKIDIIGHVDKRQELRITGSKLGTSDLLGVGAKSPDAEESQKLNLFSISSNHAAFAVQIQDVPNDAALTDEKTDEQKSSEVQIGLKMAKIFADGIRQYDVKSDVTSFMQNTITSGLKMFRDQSPKLQPLIL
ncbi:MAG: hypothetical protein ACRC46_00825 [Thermoguttaceae bacterium]